MSKHHLGQVLKRPLGIVAGLVLCLALGACSQRKAAETMTTPQGRATAERVIADLQRGAAGDDDILALIEPPVSPQARSNLPDLRAMVPSGAGAQTRLVEGRLVMSNVTGRNLRYDYLTYEVSRGDRRALVRFELVNHDGYARMLRVDVNPIFVPAEDVNPFTFGGKPLASYLVLALLVLSSAISIAAAILVFRTPGIRRKWLWVFGCLLSFGEVKVNWSSGEMVATPMAVHLLGGTLGKDALLDPWLLTAGLPLIALAFFILRNGLQRPTSSRSADATA